MWAVMFQLCLWMSCQIISGHLEPQTWKVAKYNLNFLSLPHSQPLTFSRFWLGWPLWPGTYFLLPAKPWQQPTLKTIQSGSLMSKVYSSSPHCCYGTEGSEPDHPNADVTSTYVHCNEWEGERRGEERRDGENKVIGLPASFSMTHHENKSAGGLNYHVHLNRALSDVVLERNPNQRHCLRLTALQTTMSVTALWINK